MLKLGIIGYPLDHTLSPVMHMAALECLNISGEYKAYIVKEKELARVFMELKEKGFEGFNVTVPYKTKIIPLIDELTETAQMVQAVNTVTIKSNGKTIGDNTDVIGFWEGIPQDIKEKIPDKTVSILGCGGSASACAIALLSHGIKALKIFGRDKEKLGSFKDLLDSKKEKLSKENEKVTIEVELLTMIDLSDTFMLVNTTPLGMFPDIDKTPVIRMELKKLPQDAIVYDIIYNPPETQLLSLTKLLDKKTINGVEMLIRQGAASLAIWLNQETLPLGAMKLAVNSALTSSPSTLVES